MSDGHFIPKHGGYESLQSYRKALIVYQATRAFCKSYFHKYDRTIDQMVQAARSGKQNIIEGSMASAGSQEIDQNNYGQNNYTKRVTGFHKMTTKLSSGSVMYNKIGTVVVEDGKVASLISETMAGPQPSTASALDARFAKIKQLAESDAAARLQAEKEAELEAEKQRVAREEELRYEEKMRLEYQWKESYDERTRQLNHDHDINIILR